MFNLEEKATMGQVKLGIEKKETKKLYWCKDIS